MPVTVVDNVDATPVIYYVQTDHLMRPARMTDQHGNWVWDVIYSPFGTTAYINSNPAVMDIRFPGQWFQLKTGLAYNWHRHYDATTGRYMQPDPRLDDDGKVSVRGIPTNVFGATSSAANGHAIADAVGWLTPDAVKPQNFNPRAMLPDGPSLYGYARQSPLAQSDPSGLSSGTNNFSQRAPSNQMYYITPPDHCGFVLQVGPGGVCVYDCESFKIFDAPRANGGCYGSVFQGNGKMLNDN